MRYGNSQISFFEGVMHEPELPFVPVFCDKNSHCIILDAGYAHEVYEEDEYNAYLFFILENAKDVLLREPIMLRVWIVKSLTSKLVVVSLFNTERIFTQ